MDYFSHPFIIIIILLILLFVIICSSKVWRIIQFRNCTADQMQAELLFAQLLLFIVIRTPVAFITFFITFFVACFSFSFYAFLPLPFNLYNAFSLIYWPTISLLLFLHIYSPFVKKKLSQLIRTSILLFAQTPFIHTTSPLLFAQFSLLFAQRYRPLSTIATKPTATRGKSLPRRMYAHAFAGTSPRFRLLHISSSSAPAF